MGPSLTSTVVLTFGILVVGRKSELVMNGVPSNEASQYCSFFNNRAPSAQPGLKNCTWFRPNSCCQQQEIEATFGRVKPLKGASTRCQLYTNYLMCYICAPGQNAFYHNEQLTVCESFCNELYDACKTATMKGDMISDLYHDGEEFCRRRRFKVDASNTSCFMFDQRMDTTNDSGRHETSLSWTVFILSMMAGLFLPLLGKVDSLLTTHSASNARIGTKAHPQTTFIVHPKVQQILHPCIILFVILMALGSCDSQQNITVLHVKQWSQQLSRDLSSFGQDHLGVEKLRKIYDEAAFDIVRINGSTKILEIRERLGHLFKSGKTVVRATAQNLSSAYINFMKNDERNKTAAKRNLRDLSIDSFIDADHVSLRHLPPVSMSLDSVYGMEILPNHTVVKIPHSVDRKNPLVVDTVQWSAALNDIFREKSRNYPYLKWQYFASKSGIMRLSPGLSWQRGPLGSAADFEPRIQPWYAGHHFRARNVVIIIDTSLSMERLASFTRAKRITRWLLGMLSEHHYVAVVTSASLGYDEHGKNMSSDARVLGCKPPGLYLVTAERRRELVAAILDLDEPAGGSDHRSISDDVDTVYLCCWIIPDFFSRAFKMAFELLMAHKKDSGDMNCENKILFVTDGREGDNDMRCTPGFDRFTDDSRKQRFSGPLCHFHYEQLHKLISLAQERVKASIFTFATSVDSLSGQRLAKRLACDNGGEMSLVDRNDKLFNQLVPFFKFLEDVDIQRRHALFSTLLTGPLVSQIDNSMVVSVSMPAVVTVNSNESIYLGIVGAEISLLKIEEVFRQILPRGVHGFIVNLADGTAMIHPNIKQSHEVAERYRFVSIFDLEMTDKQLLQFVDIMQSLSQHQTGDRVIARLSRRAVLHDGVLHWRPTKSSHYYYATIPGTHFAIVLVMHDSKTEFVKHRAAISGQHIPSYLHTVLAAPAGQHGLTAAFEKLRPVLDGTNEKVSMHHSTVAFGPQAFCSVSDYFQQFGTVDHIADLQEALNKNSNTRELRSATQNCRFTHDASVDVSLTRKMESFWLSRNTSAAKITSTFAATPNGVFRAFPGIVSSRTDQPDPTRQEWYTSALLYQGKLVVRGPQHTIGSVSHLVTVARSVQSDATCQSVGSRSVCHDAPVVAVVGASLSMDEWNRFVTTSVTSKQAPSHPACNDIYPCFYRQNQTCQTVCQVINEQVERITPSRSAALPFSAYSCVLRELLRARVIIKKIQSKLQSSCHQENVQDWHARIDFDCKETKTYYAVNRPYLEQLGGVYNGSIDWDESNNLTNAKFFLTSVEETNLFLLVISDYNNETKTCARLDRTSTCHCDSCAASETTRFLSSAYHHKVSSCRKWPPATRHCSGSVPLNPLLSVVIALSALSRLSQVLSCD